MAPSNMSGKVRKKTTTREARYKKTKAAELAARTKRASDVRGLPQTDEATSWKGKQKARDEEEEDPHPFRYKSFNDRLATVHINVATSLGRTGTGALAGLDGHGLAPTSGTGASISRAIGQASYGEAEDDSDDDDDELQSASLHAKTSFGVALLTWRELNLSLPFTSMAQRMQPLSLSLPLLLHNQTTITTLLSDALHATHSDSYLAYEPALDLIPRLAADLGSSFLASYATLMKAVLRVTTISKLATDGQEYAAATIVERAFESLAAVLRCMAPFVLREVPSDEGVPTGVDGDQRPDWLVTTWELMRPYLGDVPNHARRFASEALAHLLRRAKADQTTRIAGVMMADVQRALQAHQASSTATTHGTATFASGVAGVWAEATKSVDSRLHSMATTRLDAVLTAHDAEDSVDACEARIVVGSFMLTALCHHATSSELLPVFEWVASLLDARLSADVTTPLGLWHLREACEWMSTLVGTRKGKRLDDAAKGTLFALLHRAAKMIHKLEGDDVGAHTAMIQLIVLSMRTARIQDLVGPILKMLHALAEEDEVALSPSYNAVVICLAESDFSAFRQVVLPSVMRVTSTALEAGGAASDDAIKLLWTLHGHGDLLTANTPTPAATRWQAVLARAINERIDALATGEAPATGLAGLSLAGVLESSHVAHAIVEKICKAGNVSGPAVLCLCLHALTSLGNRHGKAIFVKAVESFEASGNALEALLHANAGHRLFVVRFAAFADAAKERGVPVHFPDFAAVINSLAESATSADQELRIAAARLLSLAEQRASGNAQLRLFAKLADVEQCGVKVDLLRERNVHVRSLARELLRVKVATPAADLPDWFASAVGLFVRSIVSTMKLNLRPLWDESRKALVDLSAQFGGEVWKYAFQELTSSAALPERNAGATEGPLRDALESILQSESVEKTFRDPVLAEARLAVRCACQQDDGDAVLRQLQRDQATQGRPDVVNYHVQILSLFSAIAPLVERHNAALMQHFFTTIVDRHDEDIDDDVGDEDDDDDTDADAEGDQEVAVRQPAVRPATTLSRNERREQLCAYLETFAQFSNPKALYRSADLHAFLYRLCTQGDNKVQRLVLDVILQWKDPAHVANAAIIRKLLSANEFREQLTSLVLADTAESSIQPGHRATLLPLLLRMMYGIIISKQSRKSGQANRKSSILTALADLPADELRSFVDVMLEPFADVCATMDEQTGVFAFSSDAPTASRRVQNGFIALLEDVVKHLGLRIIPLWSPLLQTTLNITHHAALAASRGHGTATQVERALRQSGLRRINDFFRVPTTAFDWQPFLQPLFDALLSPRLPLLRVESTQSPSVVLDIVHTWSDKPSTVFLLVDVDASLLTHVMACLDAPGVKPSVIGRILDVVESVVAFDDEELQHVRQRIIQPHITALVGGYEALVRRCESVSGPEAKALGRDELFGRILAVLARLAAHVEDIHDVTMLLTSLAPLLRKSNYIVSERSKADVLSVFDQLMPAWLASGPDAAALEQVYETFCSLFSRIRARSTRATLCRAFVKFVDHDAALQRVSHWVDGLNAYDVKRMQEYDFDRRLAAFDALNGEDDEGVEVRASLTARQWSPLLNNFVYYMHDPDELALRTSAGTALRKYIDTLATHQREQTAQAESLESLFTHVVFAGLRRGLRSKSDLVKREAIATIGHAVAHLPGIAYLAEMQALLVDGDDEANFFNNILHIQVHRRVRALARLGQEVQRGTCSSRTIADVHLPLVEQFFLLDNNTDGNLLQQAIECLGQLAGQLAWGPYNVLLWKYLAFKRDKDQEVVKVPEKVSVRAAMSILDNFHFDMNDEIGDGDDGGVSDAEDDAATQQREARRNVLDTVRHRLLPKLMACLDLKDDMDDVVRLPIAVGIARVLLRLPVHHRRTDIVRLLNTMAHVFRSKAQDTRNLARTTLAKVAVTLGAAYFAPLVVELRKVLNRGPQLAVLAFTVHNVLVHCIESGTLSMLQDGTSDVVEVVIEDIFGRTSEDRHSVEHRTTYKEVKATKSMDTYEHVSRIVAPNNVRLLLLPLKELMRQTEAVQATRSFDECLRRIAAGLQHNAHLSHDDYLVLCHSLLSQNTTMLQAAQKGKAGKSKSERRTSAVLAKRQDVEQGAKRAHYAHNAHRFVAFGLDLLSTALRRGKFDFNDANDVAKMEPLVDVVGNSLYAQQTSIVVQALRCMGLLIPCKLDSVRPALPTITKQTLKLIEGEGNGRSDILMASLKLLTILVSKGGGDDQLLTERQMTMLCRLVDVHVEEELEMQGTLFGLVRALIARKHAVPELYDLMDKVARMLVLQQSDSVRTTCRATYLDFLLNVPQAKKRFDNQVDFLVKNAAYEFESGRLSVLDMLRLMLDRMSDDVMRAYLDALFMAMVLRLTNDESAPCRRRAGELLRRVLDVCTPEEFEKYVQLTQTWSRSPLTDAKGRNLVGVAAMVFGIMLDVGDGKRGGDWQSGMLTQFVQVCATCADRLEEQEVDDDGDDDMDITADEMLSDWQVPYQSLQLIVRLFQQREAVFPGTDAKTAMAHFDGAFVVARRLLLYPHAWVRKAASRFFSARFAALPVDGAAALLDVQDTVDLCKKFALVLRSPQIDEPLATQVVKNLVYVAKCFATVDVQSPAKSARVASKRTTGDDDDDDVEEDDEYEDVLWRKQPLRWLFNKLSHQLRRSGAERAHLSQGAFLASSAILKWMAATMGALESVAMCERYLVHVVAPLQRIMESEAPQGNGHGDVAGAERRTTLQALATEVQEMLLAKVGTQAYAATYARVRRKVNDKRQQRRTLTVQRAIEHPEQATARKVQRNQRKHESRKRKTNEFARNKDRARPAKRQR